MIAYDRFVEVFDVGPHDLHKVAVGLKQAGFRAYRTGDANHPFGIDVLFAGDEEFTFFKCPREAWDACRARFPRTFETGPVD